MQKTVCCGRRRSCSGGALHQPGRQSDRKGLSGNHPEGVRVCFHGCSAENPEMREECPDPLVRSLYAQRLLPPAVFEIQYGSEGKTGRLETSGCQAQHLGLLEHGLARSLFHSAPGGNRVRHAAAGFPVLPETPDQRAVHRSGNRLGELALRNRPMDHCLSKQLQ